LVFVTKYRRNVLTEAAHETLRGIFAKVCQDFEAVLVESNGEEGACGPSADAVAEDDHVHLLVEYPPKVAISTLVNSLKGNLLASSPATAS
jgi:putative transposase